MKFFESLLAHILGMLKFSSNFKIWPPLSGGYLHCKFITELDMRENCNFVVPVNILMLCAHPILLSCTTHYLPFTDRCNHISTCMTGLQDTTNQLVLIVMCYLIIIIFLHLPLKFTLHFPPMVRVSVWG